MKTITFYDFLDFTDYIVVDGLYVDCRISVSLTKDDFSTIEVVSIDTKDLFIITYSEQSVKIDWKSVIDTPFYRKFMSIVAKKAISLAEETDHGWI